MKKIIEILLFFYILLTCAFYFVERVEVMTIAGVHCWIFSGGALRVFQDLMTQESFTQGKVFTLVSDRESLVVGDKKLPIITALPRWLNRFFVWCTGRNIPILSFLFDYRNLMFFYPCLMKLLSAKIRRYHPQKIVISSFAIAKNITVPGVHKILYLHSPMQYIWSHYEEYTKKLSGLKLRLYRWITPRLRRRDQQPRAFDEVRANSQYTATLAKELYWLSAQVRYPKIDPAFFSALPASQPKAYYIYLGRLTTLVKEVDRIIKLFNHMRIPLIIMGNGPDEEVLKALAGDSILFIDWIDDVHQRIHVLANAQGCINLTKESFGITTAESLLLGVPVFGYAEGATPELVDIDSGILVDHKDEHTLITQFSEFVQRPWDRKRIKEHISHLLQS